MFNIEIDEAIQEDYQNGKYPSLLSYEKIEKSPIIIPCLEKYLIGAKTYLNQPTQYFDIFRSNRHINLLLKLNGVIDLIKNKIIGGENKIKRLKTIVGYDQFEATMFEVLVAARYSQLSAIESVSFIEETQNKTPDIEVKTKDKTYSVECKKYDRMNDFSPSLRDKVRELMSPVYDRLYKENINCLFEIIFYRDPHSISYIKFGNDLYSSAKKHVSVSNESYSIIPNKLDPIVFTDFVLYPSPQFFKDRYNYETKSEWQGILHRMYSKPARKIDLVSHEDLFSTWLDSISWEVAAKWKIENEEIIWKQKKLAYNRLFKAMAQLKGREENSILHIWFERDTSIGHRKNELLDFFHELEGGNERFSWLIFNETELDVNYDGMFDFIEHAHIISGPTCKAKDPMVSLIFTEFEKRTDDFGVGYIYKD
jgi:hypothetical protein